MKVLVDRLSTALADRYVQYLDTFLVDLWSDAGFIEFRCGFSLLRDRERSDPYEALATSTYVCINGYWWIAQHHQTQLPG